MKKVKCPVCGGPAEQDEKQESTIYCRNKNCNFMGIDPTIEHPDS